MKGKRRLASSSLMWKKRQDLNIITNFNVDSDLGGHIINDGPLGQSFPFPFSFPFPRMFGTM